MAATAKVHADTLGVGAVLMPSLGLDAEPKQNVSAHPAPGEPPALAKAARAPRAPEPGHCRGTQELSLP